MARRSFWLLVIAVGVAAALLGWRGRRDAGPAPRPTQTEMDPRLAIDTPYRNVHPDAQYVGDAACARCHAEVAQSYASHPMGQSLMPASPEPMERLAADAGNPFQDPTGEYRYWLEQKDGRLWHHEDRMTQNGEVLFSTVHPAAYAVGSGQHGRSYLIDRDGWLFLSPITWYPQQQTWALSPGYEKRNQHFTRPITTECLFCHTNFADHVSETVNRYRPPIFRGHTIGCERCHGPGQLHAVRHELGEKVSGTFDETIVNPKDLERTLRDAVCQQCHLGGDVRIARRGRELYDFRPGLPWHLFAAVYVKAPHLREQQKITGHVEQMHASRCWQASQGKLGCISCHDPHVSPPLDERPAFYRGRCLKCHETEACHGDDAARTATSPPDNCLSATCPRCARRCSMRPSRTIVCRDERSRQTSRRKVTACRWCIFIATWSIPAIRSRCADLGVALVRLSDENPSLVTPADRATAISLLEAAIRQHPDDWDALEALAHSVWSHGQQERSLDLFQRVLASRPQREFSLYSAASRAQQLKRYDLAVDLWRRTIDVNPWVQRPHQSLALALGEQRDWKGAETAARRAIELFPGDSRSRQLLVECHLGLGNAGQADAEFATLLSLEPEKSQSLRRWYEGHPARREKP